MLNPATNWNLLDSCLPGWLASTISDFVLPMFASACCLIQLAINVVAGGCAGFNTVLGPARPFSLALLLYLTAATIKTTPRPLFTTTWRWSLALLPELLHWYNQYVSQKRTKRILQQAAQTTDTGSASAVDLQQAETTAASTTGEKDAADSSGELVESTIELDIPTMGCVACINTIDAALWKVKPAKRSGTVDSDANVEIVQAASSLYHPLTDGPDKKGGRAVVKLRASPEIGQNAIQAALVDAVAQSGFDGATVQSVRFKTISRTTNNAIITKAEETDC